MFFGEWGAGGGGGMGVGGAGGIADWWGRARGAVLGMKRKNHVLVPRGSNYESLFWSPAGGGEYRTFFAPCVWREAEPGFGICTTSVRLSNLFTNIGSVISPTVVAIGGSR
jgi:hypothetical protein